MLAPHFALLLQASATAQLVAVALAVGNVSTTVESQVVPATVVALSLVVPGGERVVVLEFAAPLVSHCHSNHHCQGNCEDDHYFGRLHGAVCCLLVWFLFFIFFFDWFACVCSRRECARLYTRQVARILPLSSRTPVYKFKVFCARKAGDIWRLRPTFVDEAAKTASGLPLPRHLPVSSSPFSSLEAFPNGSCRKSRWPNSYQAS